MFLSNLLLAASHLPGFKSWHPIMHRTHETLKCGREVFDIQFRSPLCIGPSHDKDGRIIDALSDLGYGYIGVDCGGANLHQLISRINAADRNTRTAANLRLHKGESAEDSIVRPFALMYDFASLFILHIGETSPETAFSDDLTDFYPLIDELLNLRLCFEAYRPILLSIPSGVDKTSRQALINYARLGGIDGLVSEGEETVLTDVEFTGGRLPVIGRGRVQEARALLDAGASLVECINPTFLGKYLKKL